jgi:hypothetical protein
MLNGVSNVLIIIFAYRLVCALIWNGGNNDNSVLGQRLNSVVHFLACIICTSESRGREIIGDNASHRDL